MRCFGLRIAWALTLFIAFSRAIPFLADVTPALVPRAPVCANAPKTVAGTYFHARSLNPHGLSLSPHGLHSRFKPLDPQKVVWCAIRSTTFLIISASQTIPGDDVYRMMVDAALDQLTMLNRIGDGLVTGGVYDRIGANGLVLHIWNANNHQLTRAVLAAALDALADFIDTYWGGALQFYIWDGANEVAQGLLGLSV